jgi:hypothetical protein
MASHSEHIRLILDLQDSKIPARQRKPPAEIFAGHPLIMPKLSARGANGTLLGPDNPLWTTPMGISSDH